MQITIKTPGFEAQNEQMRRMSDRIKIERQAASMGIAIDMQKAMQQPGTSPTHPIKWDSERQRRAFFATNGFGGGIPHVRDGSYENSFKIEPLPDGVKFFSNTKALPFVGGNAFGLVRSGIHAGRWQLFQPVLQDGFSRLKQAHVDATQYAIRESLSGL
jgi:hypothetical protein